MFSCSVHWVNEQGWAEAESFIHGMQDLQASGITGIVRPCAGVWCVTDVLTAVPHDHQCTAGELSPKACHTHSVCCHIVKQELWRVTRWSTPGISCGWRPHICIHSLHTQFASLVTCAVSRRRTRPLLITLAGLSDRQRHCLTLLTGCNRKGRTERN